MNKQGKTKLSWTFDCAGITLFFISILIIKQAANPLVEIIAGILATIAFGLIAGAKYV